MNAVLYIVDTDSICTAATIVRYPLMSDLVTITVLMICIDLSFSLQWHLYPLFTYVSFHKFCTLYVFSLQINLFYKIHLQAFNVISIVLYHSSPSFGQVLYSCLDTFVVDASAYSDHLIRHLPNASEAFPTEWFLQFWEQVKVWWAEPTRLCMIIII
jgi:hypothetical protein